MDHQNIVKFIEYHKMTRSNIEIFVMEFLKKGDLFDYIVLKELKEKFAKAIFHQMIDGNHYFYLFDQKKINI